MSVDVADVTVDSFAPLMNQSFTLGAADAAVSVRLGEVRALGQTVRAGGAFVLTFVQGQGTRLTQGIYPVAHPALGTLDLFLVPIGPVSDGFGYEAVFA